MKKGHSKTTENFKKSAVLKSSSSVKEDDSASGNSEELIAERLNRQEKERDAQTARLRVARVWIFIVLSYYFVVMAINIIPDFNDLEVVNKVLMYIMLATALIILAVNISTFWFPMWPIKQLLVIQAIQMSLLNFNSSNALKVIK